MYVAAGTASTVAIRSIAGSAVPVATGARSTGAVESATANNDIGVVGLLMTAVGDWQCPSIPAGYDVVVGRRIEGKPVTPHQQL